ncbi:MAG: universal stress protein, partial [Cellulomonas sp.]|nr:universal stress protein [Cellulomonas sp.]
MLADGPVVIALDGSLHSAQTLRWGVAEATMREAPVLLTRVYREPRELVEWGWYPLLGTDLGLDSEVERYLADQFDRVSARNPHLTVETRVLSGSEVPAIRQLSERAQLLVIGARGHASRLRIGSISGHLAAHARCPVAVVRGEDHDDLLPGAPVVVGIDGSPASIAAAGAAGGEGVVRGAGPGGAPGRPPPPTP